MTFQDWAQRHPAAAGELLQILAAVPGPTSAAGQSEARAQQQVRMGLAAAGGLAWRNNVGATPSRCPHCGDKLDVVRYGLANDSTRLNSAIKSADLIGVIPRLITPQMVGQVLGQFVAIECKAPGWHYTGTEREQAQAKFLMLVQSKGGAALFSTGEVLL